MFTQQMCSAEPCCDRRTDTLSCRAMAHLHWRQLVDDAVAILPRHKDAAHLRGRSDAQLLRGGQDVSTKPWCLGLRSACGFVN